MRKLTKKLNNNTFVGSDGSDVNGYQMEGGGRRFKKMRKAPGKFLRSVKRSYKKQHLGHKGHTYRKGRLNNTKKRLNQKTTHHTKKIEASQKRKTALEHEIRVAGKKMESNDSKYKIKYQNIINKSKKKLITEEQRMRNSEKSLSKIKRNTEINVAKLNKVEKDYEKKLEKKTSKMENIHSKYKTMGGIKKFFRSKVPFSDAKRYKSIKKAAKKTGQTTTQFLYNENGKLKPNVLNNIIAKRESKKSRFSRGYSKNISQWIKNRKKKISSTTDANSGIKIAGEKINEAKGLIKNLRNVPNNLRIDTNKVELNRRKETDSKRRQQKVLEFRKDRNRAFLEKKKASKKNEKITEEDFKEDYHKTHAKNKFGQDYIKGRNDYKIAKNANIIGDVSGREDLKKLFKKQITGPNPSWNTNKFKKYKELKNKGNPKTKAEIEKFEELKKNRADFKKTFLETIKTNKQNEQKIRQERREKNIREKYDQEVQERIIKIRQKIKDYQTSNNNKKTVKDLTTGAQLELLDLVNYQKLREQQQQTQK